MGKSLRSFFLFCDSSRALLKLCREENEPFRVFMELRTAAPRVRSEGEKEDEEEVLYSVD